jgi:hypothetical protein
MALTLTFLAGVYQFAFGLARFGTLVNFVIAVYKPYSGGNPAMVAKATP